MVGGQQGGVAYQRGQGPSPTRPRGAMRPGAGTAVDPAKLAKSGRDFSEEWWGGGRESPLPYSNPVGPPDSYTPLGRCPFKGRTAGSQHLGAEGVPETESQQAGASSDLHCLSPHRARGYKQIHSYPQVRRLAA